jgi:AcrR family transcriptional regulator
MSSKYLNDSRAPQVPARPRGRPRDPERMARVIEAAEAQFSEHGYEGASIDAIAVSSGVSKVTIYSYFPTKADLFRHAITHRVESQFAEVDWARLDPGRPREALSQIGRAFLGLMRSADVIKKHRTLYGTQGLDSAAAESYFAAGPQKLVDAVAGYLASAHQAGSLQVNDAALAANQFLSMFLGLGQIRAQLGLSLPSKREDDELLKANVELFIRGTARKLK